LFDDQVRFDAEPLVTLVGEAAIDTEGAGAVTLTAALVLAVPPAPVQVKPNVVLALSAPVLAEPEVAFVPLHPPVALHEVALVDDQVKVEAPPLVTLLGEALIVAVGAGVVTATLVEALELPPAPVQTRPNVVFAVSAPVLAEPDVPFAPLQPPVASQEVALVDDQLSVEALPLVTLVGEAPSEIVGAGVAAVTATLADALVVPPPPVQMSTKVVSALNVPVLPEPEVGLAPLQPPEAVHEVASVEDQFSVEDPPLVMLVGDALRATVGAGGVATLTLVEALALPPVPVQVMPKVVFALNAPVLVDPDVATVPLQPPDAVQAAASVEDQFSVDALPLVTLVGEAASVTVGAGGWVTSTVVAPLPVPPLPVQLSVKLVDADSLAVVSEPEVAREPLQPPDAMQEVALLACQFSVVLDPLSTAFGVAPSVTAGSVGLLSTVLAFAALPALSTAVTVIVLSPEASVIAPMVQVALVVLPVNVAVPLPPRSLTQVTRFRPLSSVALPVRPIAPAVAPWVWPPMVTVGGVRSRLRREPRRRCSVDSSPVVASVPWVPDPLLSSPPQPTRAKVAIASISAAAFRLPKLRCRRCKPVPLFICLVSRSNGSGGHQRPPVRPTVPAAFDSGRQSLVTGLNNGINVQKCTVKARQ
jgi:hypothetical protein